VPQNLLPGFLDNEAYDAWQDANGHPEVQMRDVLVPHKPTIHDGQLVAGELMPADALHRIPRVHHTPGNRHQRLLDASFESYNQRLDGLDYVITLLDASQRETARFMANCPSRRTPAQRCRYSRKRCRRMLRAIALTGKTNTDHRGRLQYGSASS
jgi:hypothetical protein